MRRMPKAPGWQRHPLYRSLLLALAVLSGVLLFRELFSFLTKTNTLRYETDRLHRRLAVLEQRLE